MTKDLVIGGTIIKRGERKRVYLDVAKLYDFTNMNIPIEVIRGKQDGPVLFVSGAVHGDELNGIEIVRQLLTKKTLSHIKGTLIAVPIVNVFGFNTKSRYLPDRRDLNRSFPGSKTGSLTGQLAHIFMKEIVEKCTHGIDLHCAAIHRINLPQIRACLDDPETQAMAEAFNVPVVMHSELRDGSLREATRELGIPTLLFEGGEALRFNGKVIKSGLQGVLSVMREIGMLPQKNKTKTKEVFIARSSHWIRAPHSGILSSKKKIGQRVKKGQILGVISDPFGREKHEVLARRTGIIVGAVTLPLVNKGDAAFHVATFEDASAVEEHVDMFEEQLDSGHGARFLD
ncbi:MAG: succinylglutamate desuccinylase/aspartoacylase family protein [Rhodospirillales bacterium]|nr:MAG: succinylglutamate desuccinylase/aspartoacylase family protein [Rhodospirillales bacterium]